MSQQSWIIVIGIVVFFAIAVIAALIWWHLADVMYPGADKKTGQRIFGKAPKGPANPGATVVKGFDQPPSESA